MIVDLKLHLNDSKKNMNLCELWVDDQLKKSANLLLYVHSSNS